MDLHIHGRNLEITDKTREHVESKLSQIDRRLPGISQAMVELALEDTRSHNDQIVAQVTLHVGRTLLRAQQRAGNAKTAVNSVAKALDQQIERFKSHSYRSERRTQAGWGNSDEVDTTGPDSGGPGGVMDDGPVVRLKEFAMEPTSVNEAAAQSAIPAWRRELRHDPTPIAINAQRKSPVLPSLEGPGFFCSCLWAWCYLESPSPLLLPPMPRKLPSMEVNSMGKIHLVDGLSPRDFRVSKYWRLMVRPSALLATALMRSKASLNPDARSTAACYSPSALRISAWRSPSAERLAACFSPSATLI